MISLHEPYFTEDDEKLVLQTLRSTWVSTGGPFVDEFEKIFAQFVGAKFAVSVVNGTVALQLALEVLKRRNKITTSFDVIVPTLSFIATSNAVVHAGGIPILVDCAPGSMNLSPAHVRSVLTKNYRKDDQGNWVNIVTGNRVLCIMPAHIMGWTCDMGDLKKVADAFGLPVIDDAAEALGARYLDGSHVGSCSLAAAYSFNGNKILTTGGGGMLVTDDGDFAKLAKHLSTTAKTDNLRYVHDQVGYNFRMVNILAALGVSQMKRMEQTLAKKKSIAELYRKLSSDGHYKLHAEPHNISNHWIVNAVFDSLEHREAALAQLVGKNIHARPLWTPAHRLDFMSDQNRLGQDFPNADRIWRTALSLPSSPKISADEIQLVVRTIGESR